jgi:hypothetical protein
MLYSVRSERLLMEQPKEIKRYGDFACEFHTFLADCAIQTVFAAVFKSTIPLARNCEKVHVLLGLCACTSETFQAGLLDGIINLSRLNRFHTS